MAQRFGQLAKPPRYQDRNGRWHNLEQDANGRYVLPTDESRPCDWDRVRLGQMTPERFEELWGFPWRIEETWRSCE